MKKHKKYFSTILLLITLLIPVYIYGQATEPPRLGVATDPATNITDTEATLNGRAMPVSGLPTTGYFRYSTMAIAPVFCNEIYGNNMVHTEDINLGSGGAQGFSQELSGLRPSTVYYYCAIASNKKEIAYGSDDGGNVQSFITLPCATCPHTMVRTRPASNIKARSANLNGYVESTKATEVYFEYKKDGNLLSDALTPWRKTPKQNFNPNIHRNVKAPVSQLEVKTSYRFRVVAETNTPDEIFRGENFLFTTPRSDGIAPYDTDNEEDLCPIGFEGTPPECEPEDDGTDEPDHCTNSIQDFDETAVDYGGSCGTDQPDYCSNGIQDHGETGIDTGGPCEDDDSDDGNPGDDGEGDGGSDGDGDNGNGTNDGDTDNDGIPDTADTDDDGDGIPDNEDTDADNDGITNGNDSDMDGDGFPNTDDSDMDGDGIPNSLDNDTDGDGIPNSTDTDDDNDGIPDTIDNSPTGVGTLNDYDGGGIPNNLDDDIDGDGIPNQFDSDTDGDGKPNSTDTDDDNDGIPDASDPTPTGTNSILGPILGIGDTAIPPNDAIVRYHEGVETVFIRQIVKNTNLQKRYGYDFSVSLLRFAQNLAHAMAKDFGYVDGTGREIRVSRPDVSAYQLRLSGNKLTVYEYYLNKIIDIRNATSQFKNKNPYEYYFNRR